MRSIARKLTLGLLTAFALLLAAGGAAVYFAMRETLYDQFDEGLRVKALVVITATEQRRAKVEVEFSDRFLREFDDDVATDFFQVWTADGAVVERSDSLERRDLPRRFGRVEKPAYWNLRLPESRSTGRAIGIKFTPHLDGDGDGDGRNPQTLVDAIVVVAEDRRELDAFLQRIAWILLGSGAGLLIATSLAVPLVLRPGLRPLRRVADQAAAIDADTLGQRFEVGEMPAELRPICERLNALLARLETSFDRERRFSADLAHELLTPLAEMRALTESAVKWPDTSGPETHRQSLEILLRMESLVTRLLELSRAEAGRLAPEVVALNIAELVRDAWRPFAAAAQAKKIEITFAGIERAPFATDPALIRIVIGNLYSNAVEYTAPGGFIRIDASIAANQFALRVSNPAPQLSSDDVSRLFDRFWRKDPSRTGTAHSGLGLSVARELAHVLGGDLTATLAPDATLTLAFTQPSS